MKFCVVGARPGGYGDWSLREEVRKKFVRLKMLGEQGGACLPEQTPMVNYTSTTLAYIS